LAREVQGVEIVIDEKRVSIDDLIKGLMRAGEYFRRELTTNSQTMKTFLDMRIKKIMTAAVKRRFRTKIDPTGRRWHKLSKFRTWQRRKKGTLSKGELLDRGKLRGSVKTRRTEDGFGVVQYSISPYAWVHQPPNPPPQGEIIVKNGVRGLLVHNWIDHEKDIMVTGSDGQPVPLRKQTPFEKAFIPERAFMGWDEDSLRKVDSRIKRLIRELTKNFLESIKHEITKRVEI